MGLLPDKFYSKMMEILDNVGVDEGGNVVFSEKAVELIHDMTPKCRNTDLYQCYIGKEPDYILNASAEDVYLYMLYKMANAPLVSFSTWTPILFIPIIDDKLRETGR
jgi:hypothetical protein